MDEKMNSNILDIEELKKELESGNSFYKEATNDVEMNGAKAELVLSVSKDVKEDDIVRLRVSGDIPIPISGGEPIMARLDRESVLTKDEFMAMDIDGLKTKIQETVLNGHNLSKEDIEKRNTEKAFSMFADIGTKFDTMLEDAKDSVLKYFNSTKPTIEAAKENLERTKIGQKFMKIPEYAKSGQEKVASIGKTFGRAFSDAGRVMRDSYQKANKAFDETIIEQAKTNDVINSVKTDLNASQKRSDELRAEIDELGTMLGKMTAGIEEQGFITSDQKTEIDLLKDIIQEKMTENVMQKETIEQCEKTLEDLKQAGAEYASPVDAAFKAKRDSYFKDISDTFKIAKQAVMAEYEVGKTALSGMTDVIKNASEKAINVGKAAYVGIGKQLSDIGKTSLTVMQAMEVKTADFLRDKAVSLTEKYQYRAEVRASAKNLLNTIMRKDEVSKPLLTEKEIGMIKTIADLADKMEARADKTAEKAQNVIQSDRAEKMEEVVKNNDKIYVNERGDAGASLEDVKKDVKPWEPQKTDENKKLEVNKVKEDLDINR